MPRPDPSRIGVLGGTFDPPHFGHLAAGLEVRHRLGLSKVLFVVANDPWQKSGLQPVTPARLRLEMMRAAVAGLDGLEASALEIDRGGESYTADTLRELRGLHPEAELLLVVGSDTAQGLDTWKRPSELRELATTVVVDRPGPSGGRAPTGWPAVVVEVPALDVSSCGVRSRFADGRPVEALVPAAVIEVVRSRGLYGCGR
ncbi:MAG: nicotinate (nicotinamide) nucleotide adenylyltransferase [Acidimicrobiaceae bacterium]|nr:nicotinate (nicotinamide) nucleotide adenylyltransferase [Acidimicrobiaceae bacterium]MYI55357.1 nicotinate (nicotinamide) nucleotide adenylyltransferase [Acidimicrobiaceae bacterium]MYJ41985.1 nicotinate (nicotinamide) nucleotide adenylyltransferase [Acidimicrobiaceae bacterium]MYJ80604.1 nicotinate (nicotinamide) nucleotide adenylyltransferase [Acidimicrobiaceae bacterium]